MELKILAPFCTIVLLSLVNEATSSIGQYVGQSYEKLMAKDPLICHYCWDKDRPSCGASETVNRPWTCFPKQNVCKKIVTKYYRIIKRGRQAEYILMSNVTSRLCGDSDWVGCRTIEGAASTTTECNCYGNLCNQAQRHLPTVLGTITATLTLAFTLFRNAL